METGNGRAGLDVGFRQNVLNNVIIKTLKQWSQNSEDPSILRKINHISINFEQKIFETATSKDDYVRKINQRLAKAKAKSKLVDALAPDSTGNQLMSTNIQRQVVHSNAAQWKPMGTSLTSVQHTDTTTQPVLNMLHQDWDLGQQNVPLQKDFLCSQVHRPSTSIKEPLETSNSLSNINRCQRPAEVSRQVNNTPTPQMPHLASSPQLSHPLNNSQGQRNLVQDNRLWGSKMPATYLPSQNLIGKNRSIPQSQMAVAKAQSAIPTSPSPETVCTSDWQVLITRFRHMRSTYLPEVIKMLKDAENHYANAQNTEQFEKIQHVKNVLGKMTRFLQMTERQIMDYPREKTIYFMNQIIRLVNNRIHKNNTGNQVLQFMPSHGQAGANQLQAAPVNSIPMFSSSSVDPGLPHSQSIAANLLPHGPQNATKQITSKNPLHQGPRGTADQNTSSSNLSQELSKTGLSGMPQNPPEKEDGFLDSIVQPMANTISGFHKNKRSRGENSETSHLSLPSFAPPDGNPVSTKVPQPPSLHSNQINDASFSSKSGPMSQPEMTRFTVDSPLALVKPSSVPQENGLPVQSVLPDSSAKKNGDPQTSDGEGKTGAETEEQDHSIVLGTHGTSPVPLQADFTGSENKLLEQSAKQPIQRLMEVVQSMSHEALTRSIEDIVSAISTVDELPEYANGDLELTLDIDLTTTALSYGTQVMGYDHDGHSQNKTLKRYISSLSRESYPDTQFHNKRPKIESNKKLVDEIRNMNQRLLETAIEVLADSIGDTGALETGSGMVVRCTYKPIAGSENFKGRLAHATALAALSIEFLVPLDYPSSSPQILDRLPEACSKVTEDLMEKARARFNCCVRGLSLPMSLEDMAAAWNESARSVFSDFALRVGGETFSSKYGTWECLPAS